MRNNTVGRIVWLMLILGVMIYFFAFRLERAAPLKVGMSIAEVRKAMGEESLILTNSDNKPEVLVYMPDADWLGNDRTLGVYIDTEGRVTDWEYHRYDRKRPQWITIMLRTLDW
jgi:hypothetical protein